VADSPFVETWFAVAAMCGRSERWCRYVAARAERPLPVFKVGGIVRMYVEDHNAWIRAEAEADAAEKKAARERLQAAAAAARAGA
jgi:hypothetical protein